ncbi:hypothetical protein [Citrobacter portucalensis]|uniref:hypothetical protein n=1 Tax=Citrobacter portucalensis TaxID=1639133 RepID=UPI00211261D1|nr:hypothetical protein [Citrobacter portucalensis]MCQ6312187.1 hypothetical protein [Citrobacter portucalensis]
MTYTPLFMNLRRLQAEAELHGCEFVEHHPVWRIFTLKKGERWTYLRNPATNEPIERIRELGVDDWKVAIAKAAEYLMSDEYEESQSKED